MKRSDHPKARLSSGMTLIELLVVVAILGLLGVAVLPALSGNRDNQANRSAAQQLSSILNQARSDAIAVGLAGGVTIFESELDVARCRVPPLYRGSLPSTRATFTNLASALPITPGENLGDVSVAVGDTIRFRGSGPAYSIASILPTGFTISLLSPASTTPLPPSDVPMAFEIERKPRVIGSTMSLPNGAAVDMACSGYDAVGVYTQFTASDEVSIVFDAAGCLKTLNINGVRTPLEGTVFLLVGRADRRGNAYNAAGGLSAADDSIGANWQYPTSYWIAIDPVSGQTRLAECQPSVGNDVEASQQWAREAMTAIGL